MQAPKMKRSWSKISLIGALAATMLLSGCSVIGDVIGQAFDVDEWFDDSSSDVVDTSFETSWVALSLNLDARSEPPADLFDPRRVTSYNAMVNVTLCDSLGVVHPVRLYFLKNDVDTWEYQALVNGAELGLDAEREVVVSQASTLRFDTSGGLSGEAGGAVSVNFEGAEPQAITIGFATTDDSITTQHSTETFMMSVEGDGCGGEPIAAELYVPDM